MGIQNRNKIISDNVLKTLYKLGEHKNQFDQSYSVQMIQNFHPFASLISVEG